MSTKDFKSLNGVPILELFRIEVDTQSATLTQGLLAWKNDPNGMQHLEQLMRASHSLKGAARIMGRSSALRIAQAMENYFVTAQDNAIPPRKGTIVSLLRGVDVLACISRVPDDSIARWEEEHEAEIEAFLASLSPENKSGDGFD